MRGASREEYSGAEESELTYTLLLNTHRFCKIVRGFPFFSSFPASLPLFLLYYFFKSETDLRGQSDSLDNISREYMRCWN